MNVYPLFTTCEFTGQQVPTVRKPIWMLIDLRRGYAHSIHETFGDAKLEQLREHLKGNSNWSILHEPAVTPEPIA